MAEVRESRNNRPAFKDTVMNKSDITSTVRVNGCATEPFRATRGLRQGCVLSPTLFNLFINDLPLSLKNQTKGVKLGSLSLHSLLYADDLAILADSITEMQRKLENLFDWCTTWGIQVNANKSAIIHFRPKTHQALYTKCKLETKLWIL